MKTYRVTYKRDADGWWVASVSDVAGCHTQGRSIEQARERIREAIEVAVPKVRHFKLDEHVERRAEN